MTERLKIAASSYGGAMAVGVLAAGQLLYALLYVGSCELRAKAVGQCESQWSTAQALLFGAGGTAAGLFTRNPLIRDEQHARRRRDSHGRFSAGVYEE